MFHWSSTCISVLGEIKLERYSHQMVSDMIGLLDEGAYVEKLTPERAAPGVPSPRRSPRKRTSKPADTPDKDTPDKDTPEDDDDCILTGQTAPRKRKTAGSTGPSRKKKPAPRPDEVAGMKQPPLSSAPSTQWDSPDVLSFNAVNCGLASERELMLLSKYLVLNDTSRTLRPFGVSLSVFIT